MTTSPVMTVTDELLAEIDAATSNATGGEWEYNMGLIRTMADSDGYVPVAVAPNVPSNWRKQRDRNMQYIALASPAAITALTTELRRLRAENAELAQSLAESRANDQAAMGWLTSLRWASGDRGERMLPELVTHIEGLAKDYARLEWMLAEQCIMRVQNGTGSPLVHSLWWSTLGEGQINWHKSARDAIDTAMQADK